MRQTIFFACISCIIILPTVILSSGVRYEQMPATRIGSGNAGAIQTDARREPGFGTTNNLYSLPTRSLFMAQRRKNPNSAEPRNAPSRSPLIKSDGSVNSEHLQKALSFAESTVEYRKGPCTVISGQRWPTHRPVFYGFQENVPVDFRRAARSFFDRINALGTNLEFRETVVDRADYVIAAEEFIDVLKPGEDPPLGIHSPIPILDNPVYFAPGSFTVFNLKYPFSFWVLAPGYVSGQLLVYHELLHGCCGFLHVGPECPDSPMRDHLAFFDNTGADLSEETINVIKELYKMKKKR